MKFSLSRLFSRRTAEGKHRSPAVETPQQLAEEGQGDSVGLSAPTLTGNNPGNAGALDPGENPAIVGLLDIVESGWYNADSGEICAGVPVLPSEVVVDVGCGDGGAIKFCANQGAHVVFLDIDEGKVRQLEKQLQGTAAGSVRGIVGSGENIDVADESADKIISTEVLEHVDDPAVVMAELNRIGKPGALYLLTVPHEAGESMMQDTAPPQYFEKPNHIRIFRQNDFRELVENAGLEVLRCESFGAYWSIFFSIFWVMGGDFSAQDNPALKNWSKTWHTILKHENGPQVKEALDRAIPNKQFILARKP